MRRIAWLFCSKNAHRARMAALPDRAAICFRPDHRGSIFAAERLLEFWRIRERPNDSILADGMRVALDHGALRFRTNLISAPLSPGNKELLLWRITVDGRLRVFFFGLLESEKSDLCAGEVADALSQDQLAVVVNAWLNEIAIELAN